jgi:hypothetical protein
MIAKTRNTLALLAMALLAALGWRLQGWELACALGVMGYAFAVWVSDWEVRGINREQKRLKLERGF